MLSVTIHPSPLKKMYVTEFCVYAHKFIYLFLTITIHPAPYKQIYESEFVFLYVCMCLCVYIYLCIDVCIHTCMCIYIHTCIYTHMYTYTYMNIYMCTYTHPYICTHIQIEQCYVCAGISGTYGRSRMSTREAEADALRLDST